jgi:hypothetical protein
MKKILFYMNFMVLTLFSGIGCAEQRNELVGQWGLVETGNECPYVLSFDSEGGYMVLNDCYGLDPRAPVVETGQFIFNNRTSGGIEFVDRELKGGFNFLGSNAGNKVTINKLNNLDLVICLKRAEEEECDEDRLKKLDH